MITIKNYSLEPYTNGNTSPLTFGTEWLREYVKDWRMWAEELRVDFWKQQRAGNDGEHGKWL